MYTNNGSNNIPDIIYNIIYRVRGRLRGLKCIRILCFFKVSQTSTRASVAKMILTQTLDTKHPTPTLIFPFFARHQFAETYFQNDGHDTLYLFYDFFVWGGLFMQGCVGPPFCPAYLLSKCLIFWAPILGAPPGS